MCEDRWGLFSDTRFRIDEFQNFDTRLTESLGGTYQVYENEGEKKWNLDAVFGAGFRLDSGLTDPTADEFVPEGNIGFRGSMEPSERQTLKGSLFLYPVGWTRGLPNVHQHRLELHARPDQGLSLRINADQEYDTARLVRSSWNVKVMVQVELRTGPAFHAGPAFHLWQLASKPENAPSGARFHAVPGKFWWAGARWLLDVRRNPQPLQAVRDVTRLDQFSPQVPLGRHHRQPQCLVPHRVRQNQNGERSGRNVVVRHGLTRSMCNPRAATSVEINTST